MKIWAKTKEFWEGKYLVVRRDGTIPAWPHFVIGGDDPCAPVALRAYAKEADQQGLDPEYANSIRELADDFAHRSRLAEQVRRSERGEKQADPDAPPHRKDNPAIIAMMRGEGDLSTLSSPPQPDALKLAEAALEDICNPLGRLQRIADADGAVLNSAAHGIANSMSYIQGIAREALAAIRAAREGAAQHSAAAKEEHAHG